MVKQIEIIQVLVNAGIQILEVYDARNRSETLEYFAVDSFIVPTASILEYQIAGVRITDVIHEDSIHTQQTTGFSREMAIQTKILALPKVRVNISKDYSFKWYLPN